MWIGIQATINCTACGTLTAANAAVENLHCDGCGATMVLLADFWRSILGSAAERGVTLDANATHAISLAQAGSEVRVRLSRQSATCPHCRATWRDQAPTPSSACHNCGQAMGVRIPPGGASAMVEWLVAEDRALVAGERRQGSEPESLSCPNCGSPTLADGTARRLACVACNSEVVVPDEIWRRVHAPSAVANWYLWSNAEGVQLFTGHLALRRMVIGEHGRVYAIGSYERHDTLMALDTDPLRMVWNLPLPPVNPPTLLTLVGAELWAFDLSVPTILRYDSATAEPLASLELPDTNGLQQVAAMLDGSVIVHLYPTNRLERFTTDGTLTPLWPPAGLLGRLFRSERSGMTFQKPIARPGSITQGQLAGAADGLRILTTTAGMQVARLDSEGALIWTAQLPELAAYHVFMAVGPDGVTWLWGPSSAGETLLIRVAADGSSTRTVLRIPMGRISSLTATMAVGSDGDVWIGASGRLERFDPNGNLRWQWHEA